MNDEAIEPLIIGAPRAIALSMAFPMFVAMSAGEENDPKTKIGRSSLLPAPSVRDEVMGILSSHHQGPATSTFTLMSWTVCLGLTLIT